MNSSRAMLAFMCLLLTGCASQSTSGITVGSLNKSVQSHGDSLNPGCSAGGTIKLVGATGIDAVSNAPFVAVTVSQPVTVTVAIANMSGRVLTARVFIFDPGTAVMKGQWPTHMPNHLTAISYVDDHSNTVKTRNVVLNFTPTASGDYPILAQSTQSVSDTCNQRELADGWTNTDVSGYGTIGWVRVS
ncbi:MAG TPA: hypothetical protein VMV52_02355 [Candidatus Nanopelagicaceae bacterium]|nr:hypothetical protein [Candidatus Nanopelagicaceae bacterium]